MVRMRKEVLFAVLAGSVLGLIIAFGIYRANLLMKRNPAPPASEQTPAPASALNIALAKPENEDVLTQAPVEFSGITKPNAWTIVSTEDNDYLVTSQDDGSFKADADLAGGADQIVASVIDTLGAKAQSKLLVVFSTEFAKYLTINPSPPPEATSTSTAEGVREKVLEKIEKALQNPKSYLGTVTDIAEQTIQVKSLSGEIKQISFDKDLAEVIKTTPTPRVIKTTDIAIGDFIVAMGFKNGNGVLSAKRILVTEALKSLDLYINLVKVDKSNPKNFEATEVAGGKVTTVTAANSTTTVMVKNGKKQEVRFVDIMDGDTVIVVGIQKDDGTVQARTVFDVIQTTPTPTPSG